MIRVLRFYYSSVLMFHVEYKKTNTLRGLYTYMQSFLSHSHKFFVLSFNLTDQKDKIGWTKPLWSQIYNLIKIILWVTWIFLDRRRPGIFHNVFNKCIALDQSHSSICSTVKNCNPEGNHVKYKVENRSLNLTVIKSFEIATFNMYYLSFENWNYS